MKQVVFASGKGGTGKSTIVASLSRIVHDKLLADCDVEAPDLHLLLKEETLLQKDYSGARIARIDSTLCTACGRCREVCRFEAIDPTHAVRSMSCEGCSACIVVCPNRAIELVSVKTGEIEVSGTDRGTFGQARLGIGAEGSGKLVTEVRRTLQEFQKDEEWTLIDGSPGIGCVVIASITATDAVVAVTEPTPSGRHDLDRVLSVAEHFLVPAYVCINKYDLNRQITEGIEEDCRNRGVPVIGWIPFDESVVKALQEGKTPVEADLGSIVRPIEAMWSRLAASLGAHASFSNPSNVDEGYSRS